MFCLTKYLLVGTGILTAAREAEKTEECAPRVYEYSTLPVHDDCLVIFSLSYQYTPLMQGVDFD